MQAGGESYHYIPALNDDSSHIDALTGIVERNLTGWSGVQDNCGRSELAKKQGAVE